MKKLLSLLFLLLAAAGAFAQVGGAPGITAPPTPFAGGTITAPILFPDGALGAPSISFSSEPDLGCYRSTADTMTCASKSGPPSAGWFQFSPSNMQLYSYDASSNAWGIDWTTGLSGTVRIIRAATVKLTLAGSYAGFSTKIVGVQGTPDTPSYVYSGHEDTGTWYDDTAVGVVEMIDGTYAGFKKGAVRTLTESAATILFTASIPAGQFWSGTLSYAIEATDATDYQLRRGSIQIAAVNKAAVETCGVKRLDGVAVTNETDDGNVSAITAGTLTYTVACSTTPSNGITIDINAVSSLTQTSLVARWRLGEIHSSYVTATADIATP